MRMHEDNLRARDEMLLGMTNQYDGRLGYIFAILLAISVLGTFSISHAEETVKNQAVETGHDVKRETKKMAHRTKEAFCAKGDAACLAEKA